MLGRVSAARLYDENRLDFDRHDSSDSSDELNGGGSACGAKPKQRPSKRDARVYD